MFQIPLATSTTVVSCEKFWDTIILYHSRPHLVNRKIAAISQVLFCEVNFHSNSVNIHELLNKAAILYELRRLNEVNSATIHKGFIRNLLNAYDKNVQLNEVSIDGFKDYSHNMFISLRIIFPRMKNCPKAIEVVTLSKEHNKVTFLAVSDSDKLFVAPPFSYQIELTNTGNLRININSFEDADTPHAEWLLEKLFPKLLKWIENCDDNKLCIQSLSLVQIDDYCATYSRLKDAYGEKLVKEWPKKSGTDPQKYVFEDIAISSYLICLWKNDTGIKFVDCGCGNGLLVFLLNQEGYEGYGIDIRKRPIWDIYPVSTRLEVGTVGPNSKFPECTWIIGNHSDELTPWIPVISLKSGPATNFFVLPCCPYDFNGQKFIRKYTSVSAYSDYLTYVKDISNKCGFETDIDKLRIPSTKRTCLVGKRKHLDSDLYSEILTDISEFVASKTASNFVQRTDKEKVKNCTQLDRSLISSIIKTCIDKLLVEQQYIKKSNEELWNRGGQLAISDLVKEIPKENLKQLKQECGGLQTLLRNHRYLFEVTTGLVKIRLPMKLEETSKYKDKPCWFLKNHPNGCLYNEFECGYKHE